MPWLGLLQLPAEVSWRLSGCSSVSRFIQFSGGLQPKQVVLVSLPCPAFPGSDPFLDQTLGIFCVQLLTWVHKTLSQIQSYQGSLSTVQGLDPAGAFTTLPRSYCIPKCAPVGRISKALKIRNYKTSQG